MIFFPFFFFQALVTGALVLTAVGALFLIGLLILDFKHKRVW